MCEYPWWLLCLMVWLSHTLVVLVGFPKWESVWESVFSVRFVRFSFAVVRSIERSFVSAWANEMSTFVFLIMALTCGFVTRPGVSGGVKTHLPCVRFSLKAPHR